MLGVEGVKPGDGAGMMEGVAVGAGISNGGMPAITWGVSSITGA
jgi:hypothetical protein